ncbi:unnamed protein product [Mytilus edulis]|uniref:Uncharacterized protein n=1 Tax=Mytilus edulis TaxID=6550 RepID=A0A8S3QY53_MYTED|nr:unnamed protein product [Mytilus edulis]
MYWFLRQQNITSNSTFQSIHDSSTDKYTVTSTLKYRVDRNYNGQMLICRACNVAGSMETYLTLDVKYAPSVTVENKTFSQTQSSRQMSSTIDSNPPVNTCTWRHKSKYGEYIRDFRNNNKTLTLPTVPEDQRYQDTGEYVCSAENGIIGTNGQMKQTGSGYVISNGNTHLVSNKYATTEEPVIVKDLFHGLEVQLDGYRVSLTIHDLQEVDFTNYTLRLYYSSQYVQHGVILESSSGPETPSNFTITSYSETSITVQWIPGFDGGHKQTFFIEYRIIGTNAWLLQETKTSTQVVTHNIYTLSGLQHETTYELRMYAHNSFNKSRKTDTATTTTLQLGTDET